MDCPGRFTTSDRNREGTKADEVWHNYGIVPYMKKVTFSVDDRTAAAIREYARIEGKPQSVVVREAVAAYGDTRDRISAAEQARRERAIEDYRRTLGARLARPHDAVDRELNEVRLSRRRGYARSARKGRRRR